MDLRVHGSMLGTDHDWPPESRPRIAAAWVLHEATNSNPYTVVVAAGVKQIASRGRHYEHSMSAEEQDVSMALVVTREFMDDLSEVLLCSDSQAMLHAMAKTCSREHVSARETVRTKEAAQLATGWREMRRGRSDSCKSIMVRLNHVCDCLAGVWVNMPRNCALEYYAALSHQDSAAHYLTFSGIPIHGNLYEEVRYVIDWVTAPRLLTSERQKIHDESAQASRYPCLAASGDVNTVTTVTVWKMLPGTLVGEAVCSWD